MQAACTKGSQEPLPVGPHWSLWENFPKDGQAWDDDINLRVQLWAHRRQPDAPVGKFAVVFRGTEANHRQDWLANLRWFLGERDDHYNLTSDKVTYEFRALIEAGLRSGDVAPDVKILATGHSLGGGLAQHMAYAFRTPEQTDLKITQVLAFDPSPVTGWRSVDPTLREENAKGLKIDRVLERGEGLSYVRDLIAVVYPPTKENPAIRGVRFDVRSSLNPLSTHSMRLLACALAKASIGTAAELDLTDLE